MQRIAKSRLELVGTLPGRRVRQRSRSAELSALVTDVRQQLSLCAVKQQARLLLDRLCLPGYGATEAGRLGCAGGGGGYPQKAGAGGLQEAGAQHLVPRLWLQNLDCDFRK